MSPVKKLERVVTEHENFPGGISSLPDKEKIVEKINEVITLLNELEEKLNMALTK